MSVFKPRTVQEAFPERLAKIESLHADGKMTPQVRAALIGQLETELDPPALTYRFPLGGAAGGPARVLDVTLAAHVRLLWVAREMADTPDTPSSRITASLTTTDGTEVVEPLVRAWFLGDGSPLVVADAIEERLGLSEDVARAEWLLRLLRGDEGWEDGIELAPANPVRVGLEELRRRAGERLGRPLSNAEFTEHMRYVTIATGGRGDPPRPLARLFDMPVEDNPTVPEGGVFIAPTGHEDMTRPWRAEERLGRPMTDAEFAEFTEHMRYVTAVDPATVAQVREALVGAGRTLRVYTAAMHAPFAESSGVPAEYVGGAVPAALAEADPVALRLTREAVGRANDIIARNPGGGEIQLVIDGQPVGEPLPFGPPEAPE